jgi:hypothetical protein
MKQILLFLISLLFFNRIYGQDKLLGILPLDDGKVKYSNVVEVENTSKLELYNRAKRWFIHTYKSGKDVIQLDDKDNVEIVGKGFFEETWMVTFYGGINVNVWQTITLQMKDGKYKYIISDFYMKYIAPPSQYTSASNIEAPLEVWNKGRDSNNKKFYPKIETNVKLLIKSLEKAMSTPIDENW